MSTTPIEPRALTVREAEVITTLLSRTVSGSGYLDQIPFTRVVATWGPGSPSVDLEVLPEAVRVSPAKDGILANGAVTAPGGAPIGELILWVEGGALSAIEYGWYTDERPVSLPETDRIQLI
ncbi:hypothetical protein ACWEVD_03660 [Nocardia thailandica]|uniref:Uncharacterized protein n=1 Tax=Nocardia thailandica TaxID=257275 RepID=A0ABW6PP19_9NOCA